MAPRLKERYREEVAPALMKEFGYGNVMQVPRPLKTTVNIGLGEAVADREDAGLRRRATWRPSPARSP